MAVRVCICLSTTWEQEEKKQGLVPLGWVPKLKSYVLKDCSLCFQKELGNNADCPYMCAYKLVTVKFKWWGLQNKVESFIQKVSGDTYLSHNGAE